MIAFKDIAIGAEFIKGSWVKRTRRTAMHKESGRIFYFRQDDMVYL